MSLEKELKELKEVIKKFSDKFNLESFFVNLSEANITYTVPEFCKMCKISRATFYKQLRKHSELKVTKIGRRILILKKDADKFIDKFICQ